MDRPHVVVTLMAKSVADRWIGSISKSEYRFIVFGFENRWKLRKFTSCIRSSKKSASKYSPHIPDLGIKERGDVVEMWSSDVDSLRKVAVWAESMGLNTDFIW